MLPATAPSRGTIRPSTTFDAKTDAERLKKAMRGLGTDEDAMIDVLTQRSAAQRQQISAAFRSLTGKSLVSEVESEVSGDLGRLLVSLLLTPAMLDAQDLRNAIKGAGTNEETLMEILGTRTNKQLGELALAYREEYKTSPDDDIGSDTTGYFEKTLLTLLRGSRDESGKPDPQQAQKDAKVLYEAGEKKVGTNEDTFISVLCGRSIPQLKLVFEEYRQVSSKDLEDVIKSETSGSFRDLLLVIVKCAKNTTAYFAERLNSACKGCGTQDRTLIRVLVSRSEIDLQDVKVQYLEKYGKPLSQTIKEETSGDYLKALLKVCGDNA